jgi:hypothetical protein
VALDLVGIGRDGGFRLAVHLRIFSQTFLITTVRHAFGENGL